MQCITTSPKALCTKHAAVLLRATGEHQHTCQELLVAGAAVRTGLVPFPVPMAEWDQAPLFRGIIVF